MAQTAGERRGWLVLCGLGAVAWLQPLGCEGTGGAGGDAALEGVIAQALADVGPRVVVPAAEVFRARADELATAIGAWQAAAQADGDALGAQAEAQTAWRSALGAWQVLEPMQIGPAASSLTAVAGADLRDQIYAWPTVNPCRVDQVTVTRDWEQAGFFDEALVNVQGLAALETLLFSEVGVNACPGQVDINADGSWDGLGDDGVQAQRAAYAVALSDHLVVLADTLLDAWSAEGGDHGGALAAAGAAGSPYESPQVALNAVFDALFYLETATKDRKLGRPLGLVDCAPGACLGEVESLLAGDSQAWIAANLVGFRALFTGGDGTGLDDVLAQVGASDLSDELLVKLDAADAAANALTVPVDAAIVANDPSVTALFEATKAVTDLLKGDVVTLLALSVPSEAAGDND